MKSLHTTVAVLAASLTLAGCVNSSTDKQLGVSYTDTANASAAGSSLPEGGYPTTGDLNGQNLSAEDLENLNLGTQDPGMQDLGTQDVGTQDLLDQGLAGQFNPTSTLVENLQTMGNFNTLVAALQATGLDVTLNQEGPFTLFAPDDAAFNKLGGGAVNELLATPDVLRNILLYHVLSEQTVDASTVILLAGGKLEMANGAKVDIGLTTDATVTINDSNVTKTDIGSSNGVIHVIDTVLTVPVQVTPVFPIAPPVTILDELNANGLTKFADAVEKAGLAELLSDPRRQFTIVAPSNDAFEAWWDPIEVAVNESPAALLKLTTRHVIADTVINTEAARSLSGQDIVTMNPVETIEFKKIGSTRIYINEAKMEMDQSDIAISNGILHVVDEILNTTLFD